ncbi:MAG TPA: hypothetical protein VGH23_22240 [Rhizomicrobium sp.]|jgi:hypothetical protein
MGGHPWWYLVPYEKDVASSLEALRQREFKAGRYNPAEPFPRFPVDLAHAPGCKHASIDEAREDSDADGTRSILDVSGLSEEPDYDAVAPLGDDDLMEFFGTTKPTAEDVEDSEELFEQIERGQGIYVLVYENDQPSQIFFAGYSYD